MVSPSTLSTQPGIICTTCRGTVEPGSKFCGHCGSVTTSSRHHRTAASLSSSAIAPEHGSAQLFTLSAETALPQQPAGLVTMSAPQGTVPDNGPATIPSFAPIAPSHIARPNQKLQEEAGKVIVLLARERLFLYLHCAIFLCLNLLGLYIAFKCYSEYIGDDVTKLMMAMTPILFINTIALMCIVPIRGTRKEIRRLRERLQHVRFQIEFNHLL